MVDNSSTVRGRTMSTSPTASQNNLRPIAFSEPTSRLNFLLKRQSYHVPESTNPGRAPEWNLGRLRCEPKISTGIQLIGIIWFTTIALAYLAIVIR